ALLHDGELLAVDLHLATRPLSEQNVVALLDIERDELAGLIASARADGDDLALDWFLLGRIGNDDAAGRLQILFHTPHNHAVVQRTELHDLYLAHLTRISQQPAQPPHRQWVPFDRRRLSYGRLLAVSSRECQDAGRAGIPIVGRASLFPHYPLHPHGGT